MMMFNGMRDHARLLTQFKCEQLDLNVPLYYGLKDHARNDESSENLYKCMQCEKRFTRLSTLKQHTKRHSGEIPHRHVCTLCDKSFTRCSSLKQHIQGHMGEKPYRCAQCNKSFTRSSSMKEHSRRHSSQALYAYDCFDNKGFGLMRGPKHGRADRRSVEQFEKPYKCTQCDKCFTLLASLKRHANTHSGIKRHQCDCCDRTFNYSSDLNRHLRTHDLAIRGGEKPYKCMQCDKCFTLSASLKRHSNVHAENRRYKCYHCDKNFCYSSDLNRHFRTHAVENIMPAHSHRAYH